MSVDSWIALAGLALVVLGTIVAGVRHAMHASYKFGQADQEAQQIRDKIKSLEARAGVAEANHGDVALLKQSLDGVVRKVDEIAHDVKNLLTGKPARTRGRAE